MYILGKVDYADWKKEKKNMMRERVKEGERERRTY
jgi:hypothetical protein